MIAFPFVLASMLAAPDAMDIAHERPCKMPFKRSPSEVVLLARDALKRDGIATDTRKLEAVHFACLGPRPVWRVMFREVPAETCADCSIGVYLGDRDERTSIIRFG